MNWYANYLPREWGPTLTKALTAAYDDALHRAVVLGIEQDTKGLPIAQAIAHRIISRANRGIYDPRVLADDAIEFVRRER
jgi:hypothetical protein